MKSGEKIDVDKMSIRHLRNVLKMILRNRTQAELSEINYELEGYHYDEFWKDND